MDVVRARTTLQLIYIQERLWKNHLILELYDIRIEAISEEHSSIDGEL